MPNALRTTAHSGWLVDDNSVVGIKLLKSHDPMKPPQISLEKILALEPACLRMIVPEAYRDENGHMNVRWYAVIFDEAGE